MTANSQDDEKKFSPSPEVTVALKVAELEVKIAELEEEIEAHRDNFLAVGMWLKSLANNDLLVLEYCSFAFSGTDDAAARRKKVIDWLYKFEDEIRRKITIEEATDGSEHE